MFARIESLVWSLKNVAVTVLFSNPMVTLATGFTLATGWGVFHLISKLGL
jgi:hypothetical protein